jgi:hypothetical protein
VVNNTSLPRFIRYNAAQAVVLDILVIIPQVGAWRRAAP